MNDYFLIGDVLLQDSDGGAFPNLFAFISMVTGREQYLFSLDSEEGNKFRSNIDSIISSRR